MIKGLCKTRYFFYPGARKTVISLVHIAVDRKSAVSLHTLMMLSNSFSGAGSCKAGVRTCVRFLPYPHLAAVSLFLLGVQIHRRAFIAQSLPGNGFLLPPFAKLEFCVCRAEGRGYPSQTGVSESALALRGNESRSQTLTKRRRKGQAR